MMWSDGGRAFQAKNAGENINVVARASDGVIEAIEHKNHPFCLGVQWHPEFGSTIADNKLFAGFVEACEKYKIKCKK